LTLGDAARRLVGCSFAVKSVAGRFSQAELARRLLKDIKAGVKN